MAVVGGAKVSTKIALLENLVKRVETLVIGGAMANTFLAAEGIAVGKSLYEPDHLETARASHPHGRPKAAARSCCPSMSWWPRNSRRTRAHRTVAVARRRRRRNDPRCRARDHRRVREAPCTTPARWSGTGRSAPSRRRPSTRARWRRPSWWPSATKAGRLLSVAGGGDTVAALNHAGVADDFTYVSTAGGAFLEWLEGQELPGVAALAQAKGEQTMNLDGTERNRQHDGGQGQGHSRRRRKHRHDQEALRQDRRREHRRPTAATIASCCSAPATR